MWLPKWTAVYIPLLLLLTSHWPDWSCWLLLIGQLDQQMSKHALILSGRVISPVRCHAVRCPEALFLLIPACVSLPKLIKPLRLTCGFCVCAFRCERLEEQLNDLTELHQNEILNLKQELASMEEKIAYQSYERARDIQVCMSDWCPQAHSPHLKGMNWYDISLTKKKG